MTNIKEKIAMGIVDWLVDNDRHYGGYFDCGEYGVCHVYLKYFFWSWDWITTQDCPISYIKFGDK